MQCPPLSVAKYRNSKGTSSVILMALVDGNYNFIYAHVGTLGKASDCGVFVNTSLYRPLECGELLAKPVPLPFLSLWLTMLSLLLSTWWNSFLIYFKSRRILENTFGVMAIGSEASYWYCRCTRMCPYLHNYWRSNKTHYCPAGTYDTEDRDSGELIEGRGRAQVQQDRGVIAFKKCLEMPEGISLGC